MHRATIRGDISGYPVEINIFDEDLNELDEDGQILGLRNIEVGVFQYFTSQMQEHGILPAYRQKSAADNPVPFDGPYKKESWKCPVHGDRMLRSSNFGNGQQCAIWQEANGNKPEWAQDRIADVRGQKRYYCRYRE